MLLGVIERDKWLEMGLRTHPHAHLGHICFHIALQ